MKSVLDVGNESQRALVNALPIPIMVSDADGVVAFFNDCWHDYTGQPRFVRDTENVWQEYLHPEDRERILIDWQAAVDDGLEIVEMEHRVKEAKTGAYRWFRTRATALKDDSGRIIQWIGAAMDIEDERQQRVAITRLYESSLMVAQTLQAAMLPRSLPQLDGLSFEAFYRPSEDSLSIGGDWYDAFVLPDGSVAIAVGDVTGHGVEAAVLMAKARNSLRAVTRRTAALQTGGAASILRTVEETLQSEHPDATATAFLGIVSGDRTRMYYANAGHPPPLILDDAGKGSWTHAGDTPLGARLGRERNNYILDLDDVSRLLLYTDGLIEAGRDIIAGSARLRDAAGKIHRQNGEIFVREVVEDTLAHTPHDDVAVLGVRFER
jgi:PAS domain S-box-containing protein